MKVTANSIRHNAERQKASFPKESVETSDFYKSIFNKIMTTLEQCVKCNFIAPLMHVFFDKR